jgi:hypothetical protein
MKKILILGAGGFIGSYIGPLLTKDNIVMSITKPGIDVTDADAVRNMLEQAQPDFVINCLTFGGNDDVNSKDPNIVAKNLAMYYNFKCNSDLFGKYINIGSGVEADTNNNSAYDVSKRMIFADVHDDDEEKATGWAEGELAKQYKVTFGRLPHLNKQDPTNTKHYRGGYIPKSIQTGLFQFS